VSTLGEVLGQLHDRSQICQLLAESGDVTMIARLDEAAAFAKTDPCDIAQQAVRRFTEKADDAAWLKLVGSLQDSEAPAATCLKQMIAWSLSTASPQLRT
jgi:hypothetical protein